MRHFCLKKGKKRRKQWETPTLFVIGGVGIIYGDKGLLDDTNKKNFNDQSDSFKIRANGIKKLMSLEEGKYFMKMAIPLKKPPAERNSQKKTKHFDR